MPDHHFDLTYLDDFELSALKQPSGIALDGDGNSLWCVCDEQKKVFQLDLEGRVQKTFSAKQKQLEDISLGPQSSLITVVEKGNRINVIDRDSGTLRTSQPLAEIKGFDSVRDYFDDGEKNKGLEGVTWDDSHIYVLKERPWTIDEGQ